jgi:hypothetical protein
MDIINPLKFHIVRKIFRLPIFMLTVFFCQNLWAYQSAIVIADKAVIYADEQMSAPLGYVRKGKKIKVGEIPRNRAQVYPIIVSGKRAFIRVLDLSTEVESIESGKLSAERFQRTTIEEFKTSYTFQVFSFASQIELKKDNDVKGESAINWIGAGLRGGAQVSPKWDFDLMVNYLQGEVEEVVFRVIEFGAGGSFRLYDQGRFKARLFGQLMAIPFATYALGDKFRVNGYGFSVGSGLNLSYRLGKNIGIEGFGGFYYMKLSGFEAPDPYQSIDPSFMGTRLGAGLNYQF